MAKKHCKVKVLAELTNLCIARNYLLTPVGHTIGVFY